MVSQASDGALKVSDALLQQAQAWVLWIVVLIPGVCLVSWCVCVGIPIVSSRHHVVSLRGNNNAVSCHLVNKIVLHDVDRGKGSAAC